MAARAAELQRQPGRVRNIAIVAHVDAGKSTITDWLLVHAGLLKPPSAGGAGGRPGQRLVMMAREDEVERGVTIKASSVSVPVEVELPPERGPHFNPRWPDEALPEDRPRDDDPRHLPRREGFLVNFVDTPGHVDFSAEVSSALRVADGAVVVLDAVEGVCVQTRTVLRQALAEGVRPVVFVNKVDRLFAELDADDEEAYHRLARCVEDVNALIAAGTAGGAAAVTLGVDDATVWPQAGTVAFGSGLYGWGFTLDDFAALHCASFGVSRAKLRKRLWGDHFWDSRARRWVRQRTRPACQVRGFALLVLRPLRRFLAEAHAREPSAARLVEMLRRVGALAPGAPAPELPERGAAGPAMQAWLPLAPLLARLVAVHLPSPAEAQRYRCARLYGGPQDDACAAAVRACDPDGPLVVHVCKMVPAADHRRFYAFGRVFSGTVRAGQQVRVQGPDYAPRDGGGGGARPVDLYAARVGGVAQLMAGRAAPRDEVCAGSTVLLAGLDRHVARTATVLGAAAGLDGAHNFCAVRHAVAPVVRASVRPRAPADLPRLAEGLARLVRSDPLVQVYQAPTGESVIGAAGELHLEVCLRDLETLYMRGGEGAVVASEPSVRFAETAAAAPGAAPAVAARSPNRLNTAAARACALDEATAAALAAGPDGLAERAPAAAARELVDELGWEPREARRVWSFGLPPDGEPNVLLDRTQGAAYLHEVRHEFAAAFGAATLAGPLAGEPLRGVLCAVEDVRLHSDARHRRGVDAMVQNAVRAAVLAADPAVLEPVFLCEVTVPLDRSGAVYAELRRRRAEVCVDGGYEDGGGGGGAFVADECVVRAHLPVRRSFGLDGALRGATGGHAFLRASFSHWQRVPGRADAPDSECRRVIDAVRARKGLKPGVPSPADLGVRVLKE